LLMLSCPCTSNPMCNTYFHWRKFLMAKWSAPWITKKLFYYLRLELKWGWQYRQNVHSISLPKGAARQTNFKSKWYTINSWNNFVGAMIRLPVS
jgi:hypothetical protein